MEAASPVEAGSAAVVAGPVAVASAVRVGVIGEGAQGQASCAPMPPSKETLKASGKPNLRG